MNQHRTPGAWRIFTATPHRMMFFAGVVQLLLSMVLWTWELAGRVSNPPLAPTMILPGIWVHGFLMLYTVFPFFIFGFLMTTYPRWMHGEVVPRDRYVRTFLLMTAGVLMLYPGIFLSTDLMALGVGLLLTGWGFGSHALWQVYRHAHAQDKRYETLLNISLLLAGLGMLLYMLGLLFPMPAALGLSLYLGLWGFLVPLLITVAHRMIPFFSEGVLQPYRRVQPFWLLLLMVAACYLRFMLLWLDMPRALLLADLPLAAAALYLSLRWGWWRSQSNRLLAMLHIAFSWLSVGMCLYVLQDAALFIPAIVDIGRAPVHALTIGFITALAMAMSTRVSLGHSGRPLQLDNLTWWLFLGLNVVAVVRIVSEMPDVQLSAGMHTQLFAALLWLACLTPWAVRLMMIYWSPRVDGREG